MADEDYGARVRAAQAFAGMDRGEFAKALGFSARTLDRLLTNEKKPTIPEARTISEVCGVPLGFLIEGWNVARPIQDRLTEIERKLDQMADSTGELTAHDRELLTRFDEMVQRLGRDIGRGMPQSRGGRSFPAAAAEPER